MKKAKLLKLMNLWPPYIGSGVRVTHISDDMRAVNVEMKLRFWNRNYVGVHFGGSLYAMTDPFFMLMLLENLGRDYIVWDKAATIRFKKPGRGRVSAEFRLAESDIDAIRKAADSQPKTEPEFTVNVIDSDGDVVAEIHKIVYVRRKDRERTSKS